MIRKFLKTLFLTDIVSAVVLGIRCCFKKPVTRDFDTVIRSPKFRRGVVFNAEKCVDCRMCTNICPCCAIQIVNGKHKYDSKKCCYCGLCEAACNFKAIKCSNCN
jgi:formate hydrogenlyase subunit 6/NADH:ubiquinone oxidoreductase subunit I